MYSFGLDEERAARLGEDGATRIRTFRLLIVLAQELRTLLDQLLREADMTTQQAALFVVVEAHGAPSLSEAAAGLRSSYQNAKQIATALERKGLLRIYADPGDRRVRRLESTAKGRARWKEHARSDYEHIREWFSDLSEAEARTLFELLLRVEERARAELGRYREHVI